MSIPVSPINYRIVIPMFNLLRSLLENIKNLGVFNSGSVERVLLSDDGSTNDILQEAEECFPGFTRVQGDGTL